jgi:hypothetical protein
MKLCINLSQKRQTLADSAGCEVNLNYNCIIVCPFFSKKSFLGSQVDVLS